MTDIPLTHVLILSSLLFTIGFVGVVVRKNTLFMLNQHLSMTILPKKVVFQN